MSCNGQTWKVQFQLENEQIYICSLEDEQRAALLFDIASIQNKCLKSKTNYSYSKLELLCILFEPSIIFQSKRRRYERKKKIYHMFEE